MHLSMLERSRCEQSLEQGGPLAPISRSLEGDQEGAMAEGSATGLARIEARVKETCGLVVVGMERPRGTHKAHAGDPENSPQASHAARQ